MNSIRAVAVVALPLCLAGCFSSGPKQDAGMLVGAADGGAASGGSTDGVVVAGVLVGGLIGNAIGADLDVGDRRVAMEAEYRALEYGQAGSPVQWRGKMGRHGDVVAGTQYRINDYNCRDYTHTIYIDGRPQVARGTACRQADGRWQAVG